MRNIYTNLSKIRYVVLLLLGLVMAGIQISAQSLLNDSFDYPAGNLYGNGKWVRYGTKDANPLQVTDGNLTFAGYEDEATGKAVRLSNAELSESLVAKFTEGSESYQEGTLYYSALISVESVPENENYIMSFVQKSYSSDVADGKTGTEVGKLFIGKGSQEGTFTLGVDRAGSKPSMSAAEYHLNETYLVVVKYSIITETEDNDIVYLFVNPDGSGIEPATPDAMTTDQSGSNVSNGIQGIELRQGGTGYKPAPTVNVDAVRVAESYAALFDNAPTEENPEITLSQKMINVGTAYIGSSYDMTVNVKGRALKGDITISGMYTGDVSVPSTTIPREQAEAAEGFDLVITLKPSSLNNFMDNVILSSEGASQVAIGLMWYAAELEEVSDLAALAAKNPDEYGTYKYTGQATVTYVDGINHYMQDAAGALRLADKDGTMTQQLKAGDRITDMTVTIETYFGASYAVPVPGTKVTVLASGEEVEPVTVTLADMVADPARYCNMLVRVENVTFTESAGETFTEEMVNPSITDGTGSGRMNIFDGTDIIGTTVPTEAVTLTGISTSASAAIIGPRRLADISTGEPAEPSWSLTPDKLETVKADLNGEALVGTITVHAVNLPTDILIGFTGAGAAYFHTKEWKITGNGTSEINVYYRPEEIGVHKAYLSFDAGDGEYYQRYTLNGICTDPDNPPTVTVEPDTLPEFAAKPGESDKKSISVTTAFLPDYLYAKLTGESQGAFKIDNTMILKNGTYTINVTFTPKKDGVYTDRIQFTSIEVDTFYIDLKGNASGGVDPEAPEGDQLPLVTDNPLRLLNESFDNVTHNKPLSLEGWKNIAMTGTRAWWGYEFKDDDGNVTERTAKVTPYDSKLTLGDEAPCQMLLVTPPLDFKNAESKIFTFRVMGDLLLEGQSDVLELCYIDMLYGDMYIAPVELAMPNIPDQNKEWMEYHINLEGQDLADVFFMGFRFNSTRGLTNTATYYIDDVSFGRTDLPQIIPSVTQLAFEAEVGKDYVSEEISVSGKNLTEDFTLTIGGPNRSKFELTTKTLPAEGGTFAVKFRSDEMGVHEAYVKIASRGAADVYIPISANNKVYDGINNIPFDETPDITVYDTAGRMILFIEKCQSLELLSAKLHKGAYIIKAVSESGTRTTKVVIP